MAAVLPSTSGALEMLRLARRVTTTQAASDLTGLWLRHTR